jgi:DNA ligase (NAD+)
MLDRIKKLTRLIKYYNYMYHVRSTNVMTNEEYDGLRFELQNLEEQFPHFIQKDSPSFSIGSVNLSITKKHDIPMLSLNSSYNLEDFHDFVDKYKQYKLSIEPKLDGVALSLYYIDGIIDKILLRGNGYEGEEVTNQCAYITNIPFALNNKYFNKNSIIRGEVVTTNKIENSRNLISGFFRKKTTNTSVPMEFVAYQYIGHLKTQEACLQTLKKQFTIPPYQIINNIEEFNDFTNIFYETDGIVIKINDLDFSQQLGYTARYPKGMLAYKTSSNKYEVQIKEIEWEINRKGNLLPIGKFDAIKINGSSIQKVFLSNKRNLEKLSIGIGSKIEIIRTGNVIPTVHNVISKCEVLLPVNCFFCFNKLQISEIHLSCMNSKCSGILDKKITYFFECLNIKGLTFNCIKRFIQYHIDVIENIIYISKILHSPNWITSQNDKKVFNLISSYHNKYNQTHIQKNILVGLELFTASSFEKFELNDLIKEKWNDSIDQIYKIWKNLI